jgi:N-acetylglucosamine-6-sulfatase
MGKTGFVLAAVVLAVVLLSVAHTNAPAVAQQSVDKPNFVFVLADDMRKDDLRYMPKTRSLLKHKGMSFNNAFVSDPVCCPSRVTIMRGQYAHNTGVWFTANGPRGGRRAYQSNGGEQDNVATRLDDAGYRTALIGKYLNGYNRGITYVPPGWDEWFATYTPGYFDYDINHNGTVRHFGTSDSDYSTDVFKRQTNAFIGTSVASGEPFFAYVAPKAPHGPTLPASRDKHTYDGLKVPRAPSFNEKDVSDKPPWIRTRSKLRATRIARMDKHHEARAEALQALDDLVESVVNKLDNAGALGNTYVVFTSDNGWHQGEHRIPKGKGHPYEQSIRMPLLIRGPGVQAGSTTNKLVLNTDYLPTFAQLAGIPIPGYVDGRSLLPLFDGRAASWRTAVLVERRDSKNSERAFYAIRTNDRKYVRYEGGAKELYNLPRDPHELRNRYDGDARPEGLISRLRALKACAGDTCRRAEN